MERFFIRDCNYQIVGNPNGYRTMRGAQQQQNQRGTAAYRAIWAAFDSSSNKDNNLISSIKLEEVQA